MGSLYRISTGDIFYNGDLLGRGYSGAPGYVNDVTSVNLKNLGPIPPGDWVLDSVLQNDGHLGPFVIVLRPLETTQLFGRDGGSFRCHGAGPKDIGGAQESSEGCIVANPIIRHSWWHQAQSNSDYALSVQP